MATERATGASFIGGRKVAVGDGLIKLITLFDADEVGGPLGQGGAPYISF